MPPKRAVAELFAARWGEPSRRACFQVAEFEIEVLKWAPQASGEGTAIYATLGASSHPLPEDAAEHRIEFFTGLMPEQDDVASSLAALGLYPARQATALDHGHTVPAEGPLWPGTDMSAFLIVRPRHEFLAPLELGDGLHIEVLQAIPIYESEREYKSRHGVAGLLSHWEEHQVAFWDPRRSAATPQ